MLAAISCKEPKKIFCPAWFVFDFTHLGPKKHTFIVVFCQEVFVADRF